MITVPCTPDEHRLIVGGATQLVVPGDQFRTEPEHPLWYRAPQRWVDATGPCRTCHGLGFDPERICSECKGDGRKRVALAVTCPCVARGMVYSNIGPDHDGSPDYCEQCDDTGSVVFAHATVEAVLPVLRRVAIPRGSGHRHAGHPTLCVGWDSYDVLRLWRFAPLDGQPFGVWCSTVLEVDPLPVPGRDFVVLLDGVELTC